MTVNIGTGIAIPDPTLNASGQIATFDKATGAYVPKPGGLILPRAVVPRPYRQATKSATGVISTGLNTATLDGAVTGTGGAFTLDTANPGNSSEGSVKLVAPATVGGFNQVTIPLGSTWNFGDGATPTGYFRIWLMIKDDRSVNHSSCGYCRVNLGTAGGFTNSIYVDVGSPIQGDGSPTALKSQMTLTPVVMPMLNPDSSTYFDTTNTGGTRWAKFGTGFATGDWAAVTQVQVRLNGATPADASTYVPPTVWVAGIDFVPLPPYAVFSYRQDWAQKAQPGMASYLYSTYGVVPLFDLFPDAFRGTQSNSELTVEQIGELARDRMCETGIYAVPDGQAGSPTYGPYPTPNKVDFGDNNFDAGNTGVQWTQLARAQVEGIIGEMQENFAQYNLDGHDILCGQERKMMNNDAVRLGVGGEDLLRSYSSFSHCPQGGDCDGWWPSDNPLRHPAYMVDLTRDFTNGAGSPPYTLSARMQARINRAVACKEWLIFLGHSQTTTGNPSGGSGLSRQHWDAIMAYLTAAGRFDGSAGKIMSHREALALSRYS